MKRLLLIALALVALGLLVIPAATQSELTPQADAGFLEVSIQTGFVLDPFIVSVVAGGGVDVSSLDLGPGCVGNVAPAPDVRLNLGIGSAADEDTLLRIFFTSDEDTTIIVQTPSGEFICNDDSDVPGADPFSPSVDITGPAEGTYNIWVGTFSQESFAAGYLMITENEDTYPGQVASSFLGRVVFPMD